jgi:N-methylhydantoinase A
MQSSGGILSAAAAGREAVRTLLSGPAAGVTGAFHAASAAGHDRVITFDMGGTSTDVSLADGAIRRTSEGSVEGWPVRVPMLDVHTVGAGGGSIAWVDAAGALRVGPQSAGSEPGPACYGRGGQDFAVTDANLLLGRLDPSHFLGGRMSLDRLAAELAAGRLAGQLGLTPVELAEGVIAVANARMEQAIRVVSVERGFDPRGFTLLPFGGAGPMHALELADALHVAAVLVPRYPGVLSALGLALADFAKDYSHTVMRPLAEMIAEDLAAAFAPLVAQAQADLAAEGFAPAVIARGRTFGEAIPPVAKDCFASCLATASFDFARQTTAGSAQDVSRNDSRLELALDLRYRGQSFELTVPIVDCDPTEAGQRFHAAHEQRYGYARPEAAVELVNVRLTARGLRARPELPLGTPVASPDPAAAEIGRTRLRFGGQWLDAPVYERGLLASHHALAGPALIVQEDATTVLIPGWHGEVDPWLNLVCRR